MTSLRRALIAIVPGVLGVLAAMSRQANAQAGPRALIHCGGGSQCSGVSQLSSSLVAAGAQGVDLRTDFGTITDYRVIFVLVPRNGLTSASVAQLVSFHTQGGTLVLAGDFTSFQLNANSSINQVTAALGYGDTLQNATFDLGCGQGATPVAHPLTHGVTRLAYAGASRTAGGIVLARGSSGPIIAAYGDRLVVSGDGNIFDEICGTFGETENQRLFGNIWRASASARLASTTVVEGASVTLTPARACSLPNCTLTWDLDCDASADFDEATGPTAQFSAAALDGPAHCEVRVRSTTGTDTVDATAMVTVSNGVPTGVAPPLTAHPLVAYTWQPRLTDPSPLDVVSIVASTLPTGAVADAQGNVTWTPTCDQLGDHPLGHDITDDDGGTTTVGGVVTVSTTDTDGDGADNCMDNCALVANSDQADTDSDANGDACDDDDDNDTVTDAADNCPLLANQDQADTDEDATGDACQDDDDSDGVTDAQDNCPLAANTDQADADGDSMGNQCDDDDDNDNVPDASDNCPLAANTDQADADGDSMGDACDAPLDVDDDDDAGGCCQTNAPPSPAGALLLALGVLAAVRRRSRR